MGAKFSDRVGAKFSDPGAVSRLDMEIAWAREAQGKPNAGEKWATVFSTVDELLDAERLTLQSAAMALSVGMHLKYEDLVEDLTKRQQVRHSS